MTDLSIIPPENIDFLSYKEKLKEYLRSQHQFTDYDFEGTNISVLIDLLARNTYYNATYLNMVGSEMFLDSAQIRSSVVSHAKELNYVPRSRGSARCIVDIEVRPTDGPASVTIPRFYKFRTTNTNGKTVFFVTDQDYIAVRNTNGRYLFNDIELFEGEVVTEYFNVTDLDITNNYAEYNQNFVISSENVDISSLEVFVAENENSTYTKFTRAENLYGIDNESLIYFVEGHGDNQYEIVFGDGLLGRALSVNNVIMVRYRNSHGNEIRGSYIFTKTTAINGYSDITITTKSRVEGGAERESTESIRYMAPKYFQTQERATNDTDYETLILKNFPTIQQVNVFGGEEIYQYGKIIVVLKPYALDGLVSSHTKRQIKAFLKPKNLVPEVVILDPDYYYLGITGNVYYRNPITKVVASTIETTINNNLKDTNNTILSKFNSSVYQSMVNDIIKSSDPYITGSDIKLTMIKNWNPVLGVRENFIFTTDNEIVKPEGAYLTSDKYSVVSSTFQTIYNDEISTALFQDDGKGSIFLYILDNSGNKIKTIDPIGLVDYVTGTVNINLDVYGYEGRAISITCVLNNDSVNMGRDKFISIDPSYVQLEIIG